MENQTERPKYSNFTRADLERKEDFWETVTNRIITALIVLPIIIPIYNAFTSRDNTSIDSRSSVYDNRVIERSVDNLLH